jgi:hypothetical protein
MKRILVFAVVLLAALFAFTQYLRRTGMFFPYRYPAGDWTLGGEDHWLTTTDGVRLHAWWFRANDANAPVLVWCHGNAGNLTKERKPFVRAVIIENSFPSLMAMGNA